MWGCDHGQRTVISYQETATQKKRRPWQHHVVAVLLHSYPLAGVRTRRDRPQRCRLKH